MLSINEAKKIIEKNIPKCKPQLCILYKNLYVFVVFTDDELEEKMDPFYSVDSDTGEFEDFAFLDHISEITSLLKNPLKVFNEND